MHFLFYFFILIHLKEVLSLQRSFHSPNQNGLLSRLDRSSVSAPSKYSPESLDDMGTFVRKKRMDTSVIECPVGKFGENCDKNCNHGCKSDKCEKTTGECTLGCKPGYFKDTPTLCDTFCSKYTYGYDCVENCSSTCKSGLCDRVNGACLNGCEGGYSQLSNGSCTSNNTECPVGKFGDNCNENCGDGCKSATCYKITGECTLGCKPGYIADTPALCDTPCSKYTYSYNCEENCSSLCKSGLCDPVNGACLNGCEEGYYELSNGSCTNKKLECSVGKFGENCDKNCGDGCKSDTCDKTTGECTLGCKPGYIVDTPAKCVTQCDKGKYGKDCAYTCGEGCKPGGCNHVTGACIDTSGCEVGWVKDALCNKACPKGRYGQDCVKTCSKGCTYSDCNTIDGVCVLACPKGRYGQDCVKTCSKGCKSGDCNAIDGVCKHGCLRGYYDEPMCNRVCAQGYWDKNCRYVCNAGCKGNKCNATTGQCGPCKPGWKHGQGGHCEEGYFYITKTFWVRSFKEKRNFFDAKRSCEEHAGHLVYPKTLLDLQKLFKKFVRYDWRPRYYGQVLSTAVWVGADDLAWEGDYRWLDGSSVDSSLFSDNKDDKNACYDLDHQRLYKGKMRYVNYGQNCAAFSETKHWYSTECCQRELPYICQWDPYDYNWPEN